MRRKVITGLLTTLFFLSSPAKGQVPENVSMDEAYGICSFATTETQGAQCFPLAWSALNSADFVIKAVTGEEEVSNQDLNYHVRILTDVSQGLLELGVFREAQAADMEVEEYVSTMYFLTLTLDEIMEINPEEFSEARMFLYALTWEARLALYDYQGLTPDEFSERREIAEARIEEILDTIFEGALTRDAFSTEPVPPAEGEDAPDDNPNDEGGQDE